jgi:hypothetical protein
VKPEALKSKAYPGAKLIPEVFRVLSRLAHGIFLSLF